MPDRMTEQQLADYAEASLPPAGTPILYKDWASGLRESEHPEALSYYRHLKKQGKVKATLTTDDDGKIVHTIERV